tara:strand:+ start:241 stop:1005 length:765 start_codon:yes stop_codon:yes gene_type:complete
MAEILSIVNQKGGVGKTTTCINLSAALAKARRRVLLIDLDPQSNATKGCGTNLREGSLTVNDLLLNRCNFEDVVHHLDDFNFDILPSTPQLTEAEVLLLSSNDKEFTLRNVVLDIASKYDYLIIDCPPSLNILTVNALTGSSGIIIPVQCEFFALQGLSELVSTIDMIKKSSNDRIKIKGIIRTMFDARNNLSNDVSEQLVKYFKDKLFKTKIPRNITLAESPSHGMPVIFYDPNSKGALSYLSLAGELIKLEK